MRKFKLLYFLLLTLVLSSCYSSKFLSLETIKRDLGLDNFPTQEEYPEADAVNILLDSHKQMEILGNYKMEYEQTNHRIIKLFKNIEYYASVEIPIYEGEKLLNISARTIKADGTIIELTDEDFYETSGVSEGSTFYSDIKSIKFTFPGIEKNCIIEYKYLKSQTYPFRHESWNIQYSTPTLVNNFSLTVPTYLLEELDWEWRYKTYGYDNIGQPEVKNLYPMAESILDKQMNFSWSLKDIPALEHEAMMPPVSRYRGKVQFAPSDWKKWDDISEWYYKSLFKPRFVITNEIKSLARELTKNSVSELDKIDALYKYTQNIRYISINLGVGGIQPSKPQTVLDREYGDCKDKAMLLISLLESIDIKAKPVLLLTADEGVIDPDFPSWRFNHMIVKVERDDEDDLWLDPTIKYAQLNELPWTDEGIDVLVIDRNGKSSIETTPGSTSSDNVSEITVHVNVESVSKVNYNVKVKYRGEESINNRAKLEDLTEEEMRDYCKFLISDKYINSRITNCKLSDLDKTSDDLVLEFGITAPNAIQKQGDLIFLDVAPMKILGSNKWLLYDERTYPIEFKYPYSRRVNTIVNYPEDLFTLRNEPDDVMNKTDELFYVKNVLFSKPGKINFIQKYDVKLFVIQPEKYSEVRDFYDDVQNSLGKQLILLEK